jgi:streptogrisin C
MTPLIALALAQAPLPTVSVPSPTMMTAADTTSAPETPLQAWRADAQEYAERFDVSTAEALRALQIQEASVPLTDRLAVAWRPRLAGVVIEHRPTWRIVVNLTGDTPVASESVTIAGYPVPIDFRTGARATRDAILAAVEQHGDAIRAAVRHPPGMGVDARQGMLAVLVRPDDLDESSAVATASRLEQIAGVPVHILTWAESDRDLEIEGGGRMVGADPTDGRKYVCTTGFVVVNGSQTGITTAAHCPDEMRFVERDRAAQSLPMIGAWGARYQDVQIHAAPAPLPPLFRADDSDYPRPVTSWRNRTSTRVGDFVCHRGERTGYSCSVVEYVDYAPPGALCAGPCPATWVAVRGPKCRGGDSGGPVFVGTIAIGTTKGGSYTGDGTCRLYYYMSTDYLPEGWTVARGAPEGEASRLRGEASK